MQDAQTSTAPFLKIILPAALGLLLALVIDVPAWIAAACFLAAFLTAILLRRQARGSLYVWVSILLFFFTVAGIRTPRNKIPYGERVTIAVQVGQAPHTRGRWQATTAEAGFLRADTQDADGGWIRVDERIQLYIDTCYHGITAGNQLVLTGWFNPVDTAGSSYGNLMRMRGIFGRIYLTPGNLLRQAPYTSRTPAYYASLLQEKAIAKLDRLELSDASAAVVTAMTAGDKRGVERELRGRYADTGAAHLLAVSGLHVGIVFILVNLLLYFLPVARRGHIIKNVLAIAAIWLYASMSGLSPSAVRAALMFSFAQAALATSSYRNALNIMLGSAVVMLAVNPNYAGDPSFLLSYSAVLAIFVFFSPLFRLCRTRFKAVNALISVMLIGFTATLGTAPLVSYWFGNFPIAGMVINPLVSITAHAIVMLGVLWVVMPFGIGQSVFSWALGAAAGAQNALVEWSAAQPWAFVHVHLPLWGVLTAYAIYAAIAVFIYARKPVGGK